MTSHNVKKHQFWQALLEGTPGSHPARVRDYLEQFFRWAKRIETLRGPDGLGNDAFWKAACGEADPLATRQRFVTQVARLGAQMNRLSMCAVIPKNHYCALRATITALQDEMENFSENLQQNLDIAREQASDFQWKCGQELTDEESDIMTYCMALEVYANKVQHQKEGMQSLALSVEDRLRPRGYNSIRL